MLLFFAVVAQTAFAAVPTIPEFAKSGSFRSPSISPDGQYLALSVHNNDTHFNEADYQLAVFHLPELKVVSRLNMQPHYQPYRIVWVSNKRLVVSMAYTSGFLDVPSLTGDIEALDFDGDHKLSLYSLRHRGSIGSGIHSMDMPRGLPTVTGVPSPRNGHVYVSLAMWPERRTSSDLGSTQSRLYDVDARTGKAVLMGDIDKGSMSFVAHDGVARLAYGSTDFDSIDVYARDNARQPWRKLSKAVTGKQLTPLRISRNGKTLWSLSSRDGGPLKLVASDLDGSHQRVLASDDFASVADVLWNEQSSTPYAAVFTDGRPHVDYLNKGMPAQVLKALNQKFPDHLVTIAGMTDNDKRMLVLARSDRDPGSVALFDTSAMNLRPLYQLQSWIHPAQMAVRKPFRFKASDGLELSGYLTLPFGKPAKQLPTVLLPHGGPIGIRDGWFYESDAQFLASLGYAVVQVNYRGSSGRGPAFEHAGYKQFGGRIQQDLLDGLHWAMNKGYVDRQRVCVYGGSFGGYSSLMQPILLPGTFKCAIDYAGVSDWSIGMRKSDTSKFRAGRQYFANAIGDVATARAISPLYHLDKFNVPVLIAHGEDDPRVPYENAKVLRAALEKEGKPYQWLSKPKEGHGFYTEADRADMYKHMQAFLAKYLGP